MHFAYRQPSKAFTPRGRLVSRIAALTASITVLAGCADLVSASPRTYFFSDCQTGAASGCVAGDNSNAGTEAAPKRDFSGMDLSSLSPGTTLLFRRGGAWNIARVTIENNHTSLEKPLTFDAYGTGPVPVFRSSKGPAFQLGGGWGNATRDGGYIFRNLKLDGLGGTTDDHWGFWMVQNLRDVVIDNVEITGFAIGIHASDGKPHGISGLKIINSSISRNRSMGFLGKISDSLFESNVFEANNFSGSGRDHAIYLSGGNNNVVRANRLLRNSVAGGRCTGGNFTIHGIADGLLIENNLVEQDTASFGCYPFSITAGYDYAESFRNVVMRGNTVINGGICAFCVNSAPGIVIENNVIHAPGHWFQGAIMAEANNRTDTPSTGAVIRNNTLCLGPGRESVQLIAWSAAGATLAANTTRKGNESTTGPCAR